jgi:DHA3 family macrolide efflux protein-like MFS transporter
MKNASWKRAFATIYAGQAFSILGSAAVQFAIVWWLTVQTGSAITLTVASLMACLPTMLLAPLAGVMVDRLPRRAVMMAADAVVALSSVALGAAFIVLGTPPIWMIYAVLGVRAAGGAFHQPAMQAAVPMLVPVDKLTQAGSWSTLVASLSTMLGPALGAALMNAMPIATVMLVDILGAAFAIGSLAFVPIPDPPPIDAHLTFVSDIKGGLATLRANKPLLYALGFAAGANILFAPIGTLLPLMVSGHFGGGAAQASLVELAFSAGSLIFSAILGVWGGMRRRFLMLALSLGALGAATCAGGLLPATAFPVFAVGVFMFGAMNPFINVPLVAYAQETLPQAQMGKVFALISALMNLAMPIGLIFAGPLSERLGVRAWYIGAGAAVLALAVIFRLCTRKFDAITIRQKAAA